MIKSHGKPLTLDEVIVIPNFDPYKLTLDQLNTLQYFLARKTNQEELRREHQQRQVLHDINDIFVGAYDIKDIDENAHVIAQFIYIFER